MASTSGTESSDSRSIAKARLAPEQKTVQPCVDSDDTDDVGRDWSNVNQLADGSLRISSRASTKIKQSNVTLEVGESRKDLKKHRKSLLFSTVNTTLKRRLSLFGPKKQAKDPDNRRLLSELLEDCNTSTAHGNINTARSGKTFGGAHTSNDTLVSSMTQAVLNYDSKEILKCDISARTALVKGGGGETPRATINNKDGSIFLHEQAKSPSTVNEMESTQNSQPPQRSNTQSSKNRRGGLQSSKYARPPSESSNGPPRPPSPPPQGRDGDRVQLSRQLGPGLVGKARAQPTMPSEPVINTVPSLNPTLPANPKVKKLQQPVSGSQVSFGSLRPGYPMFQPSPEREEREGDADGEQIARLTALVIKLQEQLGDERETNSLLWENIEREFNHKTEAVFSNMLNELFIKQIEVFTSGEKNEAKAQELKHRERNIKQLETYLTEGQKQFFHELEKRGLRSAEAVQREYIKRDVELSLKNDLAKFKNDFDKRVKQLHLRESQLQMREQSYKTMVRQVIEAEMRNNFVPNSTLTEIAQREFKKGYKTGIQDAHTTTDRFCEGYNEGFKVRDALAKLKDGLIAPGHPELGFLNDPYHPHHKLGRSPQLVEQPSLLEVEQSVGLSETKGKELEHEGAYHPHERSPAPPPNPRVVRQTQTFAAQLRGPMILHNGAIVLANTPAPAPTSASISAPPPTAAAATAAAAPASPSSSAASTIINIENAAKLESKDVAKSTEAPKSTGAISPRGTNPTRPSGTMSPKSTTPLTSPKPNSTPRTPPIHPALRSPRWAGTQGEGVYTGRQILKYEDSGGSEEEIGRSGGGGGQGGYHVADLIDL